MTKRRFTLFFCIMFWIAPSVPAQEPGGAVDLALCLDTSSSMSGPLDAARMQLWEIVNELALLEPTPRLRVALLSYGNPVNDPARGWVRLETPLTEDLDLVSQRLFDLTSDGGDEYVARAIKIAVEELEWSESDNALKMILIAGNEAADQDPELRPEIASEEASRMDIMVNAIFFGSLNGADADAGAWTEMTDLGGGEFSTFDPTRDKTEIITPFDIDLVELGTVLNDTSIPLSEAGEQALESQIEQDRKVFALGGTAAANRAQTKASALYRRDWDLVDLVESEKVVLYDVDEGQLPAFLLSNDLARETGLCGRDVVPSLRDSPGHRRASRAKKSIPCRAGRGLGLGRQQVSRGRRPARNSNASRRKGLYVLIAIACSR